MVLVIASDIVPFLGVLAVATAAATFFFVIDLPESINYQANPIAGIMWPAVTMMSALLGNFDILDYVSTWSSYVLILQHIVLCPSL